MGNTWPDKIQAYKEDPHIIEVAQRVWEVEKVVAGARDAMTFDGVLQEVAQSVAMWKGLDAGEGPETLGWLDKPIQDRRLHGYFEVTAGPHDGWSIAIRVGSIYNVHLHDFFEEARARQAERDKK